MVQVAAAGDVRRRGDPVVVLQLRGASGASDWVARSVQRVVATAVTETVEAVRPPGGHQRVGAETNCGRTEAEIQLTDVTGAHSRPGIITGEMM